MPAVQPRDVLLLPRVGVHDPAAQLRPVRRVIRARHAIEGEGFEVRRPFPGAVSLREVDPFLLLDHMGAVDLAPGEAKGTPWHPHRGFETVTYMMDGQLAHQDTTGGGGMITDGATQWMTAGDGILHIEQPSEQLLTQGGVLHGVQLWVNLPRSLKRTPPRYQGIEPAAVKLLSSTDGGAVLRVIAGELSGHQGPGSTWTPITYVHATLQPGARVELPWPKDFNALVYALNGSGFAGGGADGAGAGPVPEGTLAILGSGDAVSVQAAGRQDGRAPQYDVLILGGRPINEPIVHYGPFVMNTHDEIVTAIEDFQAGRMGVVPALLA